MEADKDMLVKNELPISNPYSTGNGGPYFESYVQASFVVLMLTDGYAPCLSGSSIYKIQLQARVKGFAIDDFIVYTKKDNKERKLLAQVKHVISITDSDSSEFIKVIENAWHDFNNPSIFNKGTDAIALITGPLNITDTNDARIILEWARDAENHQDFFMKVREARFSSKKKKQEKLKVFENALAKANGGENIASEIVFEFLKHFHLLGYDLDLKSGVTLSLLHSHLKQSSLDVESLWARIVMEVQSKNPTASIISRDTLPESLLTSFQPSKETIPSAILKTIPFMSPTQYALSTSSQYVDLAIANLIGAWNENNEMDKIIVSKVLGERWDINVRSILQIANSPLLLKNGIWQILNRQELWNQIGNRIFDSHLVIFKECAVTVLKTYDPIFDVPPEQRYLYTMNGNLNYSYELRNGLAESVALLGCNGSELRHCSVNNPQTTVEVIIREVLKGATSKVWGTLNDVLPILAEAAPRTFLNSVENTLIQVPNPFDELFEQEDAGVFGKNYLTGLLWGLETLAWDEEFFTHSIMILGKLASHDPGGNWANRPANSLVNIFLPWFPQTNASIEKRKIAIETLIKELPEVAWKLLISLLPSQRQSSTGSRKPLWRQSLYKEQTKISDVEYQAEYQRQITNYTELMVSIVVKDFEKLNELIKYLDIFPYQSLTKILNYIASAEVMSKTEDVRYSIWNSLQNFVARHKRFADAPWALKEEEILNIENVAKLIKPDNSWYFHHRLFNSGDFDLYQEIGDDGNDMVKLESIRQQAIQDILDNKGIHSVLDLAESVNFPAPVGYSLAQINNNQIDSYILPALLETNNNNLMQLVSSYIALRYINNGWDWCDSLNMDAWPPNQIGIFLTCLPVSEIVWDKTVLLLKDNEQIYWKKLNTVKLFNLNLNINYAIYKLLEYGRAIEAASCLAMLILYGKPISIDLATKVLLEHAVLVDISSRDVHNIVQIIKYLQNTPEIPFDDICRIEWAYLPLLEEYNGAVPKFLGYYLASSPQFFCEVIQLIYRSDKKEIPITELSTQEEAMAHRAWQLLHNWKIPPDYSKNENGFSEKKFNSWIKEVQEMCLQSGHLDVALYQIGQVLIPITI